MNKGMVKKEAAPLVSPNAAQRGFEEPVDREDIIFPRVRLLQSMSPEITSLAVTPGEAPKLWPGLIINSLTKEILPGEFIPVFCTKNWARFNPRDDKHPAFIKDYDPGALIWRSNDPLDPRVQAEAKFGADGENPLAVSFLNFLCYFPGADMPLILSFSRTSYKAGKKLLSLSKFSGKDMFALKYKLTSKQEAGPAGPYFVLNVEPAGAADLAEFTIAENLWQQFHVQREKLNDAAIEDEAKPEAAAEASVADAPDCGARPY